MDLRFGRWEDVLADVRECDAVITDAPYSERTHSGHDGGVAAVNRAEPGRVNRSTGQIEQGWQRSAITYQAFSGNDVCRFVRSWSPRVSGWFVSITDHVLGPIWAAEMEHCGRYVFAPIPFVETGSRVRLSGDGPSTWTCWVIVGRPKTREFQRWGTLPGAYVDCAEKKPLTGGKPIGLMRALIRDYTRKGDLIVDPCAGAATTLIAAGIEGRRAIGAECDPATFEIAQARMKRGYTPVLEGIA